METVQAPQTIPTIDASGLRTGASADLARIGAEIGRAARDIGFFSIANHGVPAALVAEAFAEAHAFFALPETEKERLSVANSPAYHGYVRLGGETLDPTSAPDVKECFNAGPDLAPDDPGILAGRPFAAVNQWPEAPSFRRVMNAYYAASLELVVLLHRAIALDLGAPERYFDEHFSEAFGVLRVLHYPPHPGAFDGTSYGAGAHTDYGNLTLLAQDDVGGLEVRRRDGTWIEVPPAPGTFVCNIGDCLMRWSNDVYVSNAHRVVNRTGRERYSIAYFGDPNAGANVTCLPSCLAPGETPKYEPVTYGAYLRSRYEATYPTA